MKERKNWLIGKTGFSVAGFLIVSLLLMPVSVVSGASEDVTETYEQVEQSMEPDILHETATSVVDTEMTGEAAEELPATEETGEEDLNEESIPQAEDVLPAPGSEADTAEDGWEDFFVPEELLDPQDAELAMDTEGNEITESEESGLTTQVDLSDCKIQVTDSVSCTGTAQEPEVLVTAPDNIVLKKDLDYSLIYTDNVNPGTAKVTVSGITELCTGKVEKTFSIVLQTPVLVSAKSKDYQSIQVTWKAVPQASSYILSYKGGKIDSYKTVKKGITGTSYVHKASKSLPLVTGTTYTYTVTAVYKDQNSGYVKKGVKAAPKPGTAVMKSAKAKAYNKIALSWSKVPGANGYRIYYQTGGGKWKKIKAVKNGKTSYTYTGTSGNPITPGVTYHFKVKAFRTVNGSNIFGGYSDNSVSVKTLPQKVKLVRVECTDTGKIKITWKKSAGANQYVIYRKTAKSSWTQIAKVKGANKTSYTHVSSSKYPIKAGGEYWYTVRPYTTKGKTWGSYDKTGLHVTAESGTADEVRAKKNARKIAESITDSSMSQSEKIRVCFDWVAEKYYRIWRLPYLDPGWTGVFANDHFENGCGCCISDACAFAYLAWAIGCKDVKVCLDSATDMENAHGWAEVNGRVYDPLFAQAKGYTNNYNASYSAFGLYPEVSVTIK